MYLAVNKQTKQLFEFEWTPDNKFTINGEIANSEEYDVYEFLKGDTVKCNGKTDFIVGFIYPEDKVNYEMGYRLNLHNEGTQSVSSCYST